MPDLDAIAPGSFDTWWADHSNEILASADRTVAAFMGYTAGRKSGWAEATAAERQRWANAVQIQIRTLRTSVSQDHQFAASVLQDLLDLVGPLAKVADLLDE